MKSKMRAIRQIVDAARGQGRDALLVPEGLEVLSVIGVKTPRYLFLPREAEASALQLHDLSADKVVIKVVSPEILHKSLVGGVVVVENDTAAVTAAVKSISGRFSETPVSGFTVEEFVPHHPGLGGEFLVALRWTEDFGVVLSLAAGGMNAELLAQTLRPRTELSIFLAPVKAAAQLREGLSGLAVTRAYPQACSSTQKVSPERVLTDFLIRLSTHSRRLTSAGISELEINPLVMSGSELIALDVLVKLHRRRPASPARRPVDPIRFLLEPRSIGLAGVSTTRDNPGRIILANVLAAGYDPSNIAILHEAASEIDGCHCYPGVSMLPTSVDLFIIALPAIPASELLIDLVRQEKTRSVILVSGGLEELGEHVTFLRRLHSILLDARQRSDSSPVINGGNCLGIRSHPGRYDSLFLPSYKLPAAIGPETPMALICQSGACAVSLLSKLDFLNPRYVISLGNQMDLTAGDYLAFLAGDSRVRLFAFYIEGFKPLDGLRFVRVAEKLRREGRAIILYRAGRTTQGVSAASSHTASLAGEIVVTREICSRSGVVFADSLPDFEDLVRLYGCLGERRPKGMRLGAVSNAGFECVAVADNLRPFQHLEGFRLARFQKQSFRYLEAILRETGISEIARVRNPLDLSPLGSDETFERVVKGILADGNIDCAIVGCVPMTPAINSLEPAGGHSEDVFDPRSLANRLVHLFQASQKPWITTVAAGRQFDAMVQVMERERLPVFRSVDRALRVFQMFCAHDK